MNAHLDCLIALLKLVNPTMESLNKQSVHTWSGNLFNLVRNVQSKISLDHLYNWNARIDSTENRINGHDEDTIKFMDRHRFPFGSVVSPSTNSTKIKGIIQSLQMLSSALDHVENVTAAIYKLGVQNVTATISTNNVVELTKKTQFVRKNMIPKNFDVFNDHLRKFATKLSPIAESPRSSDSAKLSMIGKGARVVNPPPPSRKAPRRAKK